jgi:Tol biopolymer transport system component/DNA-binding winged helix-turn-helix (wHTH) protein
MEAGQPSPDIVRFGVFEVDLRNEELRKSGHKIRLRGQPFQVLAMLLERPGEVVTREEIQKKLWPDGTFVDFDHSLNTAITKIREILGDSAEDSRFIETLPRRGYRFIAPVQGLDQTTIADLAKNSPPRINEPLAKQALISPAISRQATTPLSRRWRVWTTLAATGLILTGLVIFRQTYPLPPPKILGSFQITNDGVAKTNFGEPVPLVTDGSRLYFSELEGNQVFITQVSTASGETSVVRTPFPNSVIQDISLSRSELLIRSFVGLETDSPLWLLPVPAGTPRRLGDLVGHSGTWSPNGQEILYAKGSDLYLAKLDGTQSRKLATVNGNPDWLRWSPDGRALRFTLYDAKYNSNSLWEVSSDGTNLHPLLPGWNDPPAECCGKWTPDGKYFVFQSTRKETTNLWAIREKNELLRKSGHEPVQLTTGPINFWSPVPSLDGKKLFVIGAKPRGELVRYDFRSNQFMPFLSGISAEGLDFSRDGEWVTYVTIPEGILWRSKLDGSQRLQLTFPPVRAALPRWAPNGKQIAFMAQLPGKPWKNHLISPEGGIAEQLVPGQRNEDGPSWSPDGNFLAFGHLTFLEPRSSGPFTIQLVNLRTRQITTLPGSEGLYSASWSPDGAYIAAETAQNQKLVLFDRASSKWTDLANFFVDYFEWSRDGKYIYVTISGGRPSAIVRIRVSDHKLEHMVSLEHVRLATGAFGPWSGLSPDNSPLVVRDLGTQEIYALDWAAP